jgi:hypothetical protein
MVRVAPRTASSLLFGALALLPQSASRQVRLPNAADRALNTAADSSDARSVESRVMSPVGSLPAATESSYATDPEPGADHIERDYPLHALALAVYAAVYSEPSDHANVFGYVRRGGRLRAQEGIPGSGCPTAWHAVLGGGFVCEGRAFAIGAAEPEVSGMPEAPAMDEALPYAYTKTNGPNLPLFAHTPTPQEEQSVLGMIASAKASHLTLLTGEPPPKIKLPPAKLGKPGARGAKPAALTRLEAPAAASGRSLRLPELVRRLLQPGYYVSLDGRELDDTGRTLLRTVRGDRFRDVAQTAVPISVLHGTLVEPGERRSLGLVYRTGAYSYSRDVMTGLVKRGERLQMMQPFRLTDDIVPSRFGPMRIADDGELIQADALRIVPSLPRPAFVPAGARYIAVQLSTQTLVAYDAGKPVFATLVSSGKAGHDTPPGIYRIQNKHIATTMDGEAGTDEDYSIEDVAWTMYFAGGLALHAAFWHQGFGRTHSHGCVNLAPLDARWLFEWSGPSLPLGFHGVSSTRENPGTFVVISP